MMALLTAFTVARHLDADARVVLGEVHLLGDVTVAVLVGDQEAHLTVRGLVGHGADAVLVDVGEAGTRRKFSAERMPAARPCSALLPAGT